jgi:hypothetical protein
MGELGTTVATTSNRRTFGSVPRLLDMDDVVPRTPIYVSLMIEVLSSSESLFIQKPHGVASQMTPFFLQDSSCPGQDFQYYCRDHTPPDIQISFNGLKT